MIELNISAASKVGCVRDNNEDMILVGDCYIRNEEFHMPIELNRQDRFMMAVADGMGGHNCGEVASSMALHNLHFYFHDIPSRLDAGGFTESIVGWLDSINNVVESQGLVHPEQKGMGTTLVALAYYEGRFFSINCGDSRLYRYRNSQLTQLTTDHSLNTMLGNKDHSSIITNCIGGGCKSSYVDLVEITNTVYGGDVYLLCSDGLTDMLSDSHLSHVLAKGADANQLCLDAEEHGGFDNVSVCKIEVKLMI